MARATFRDTRFVGLWCAKLGGIMITVLCVWPLQLYKGVAVWLNAIPFCCQWRPRRFATCALLGSSEQHMIQQWCLCRAFARCHFRRESAYDLRSFLFVANGKYDFSRHAVCLWWARHDEIMTILLCVCPLRFYMRVSVWLNVIPFCWWRRARLFVTFALLD